VRFLLSQIRKKPVNATRVAKASEVFSRPRVVIGEESISRSETTVAMSGLACLRIQTNSTPPKEKYATEEIKIVEWISPIPAEFIK
jgi:hypothetical protein